MTTKEAIQLTLLSSNEDSYWYTRVMIKTLTNKTKSAIQAVLVNLIKDGSVITRDNGEGVNEVALRFMVQGDCPIQTKLDSINIMAGVIPVDKELVDIIEYTHKQINEMYIKYLAN